MRAFTITLLIFLIFHTGTLSCQIISSLDSIDKTHPTSSKDIIKYLDEDDVSNSIIHDWSETLKEFKENTNSLSNQDIKNQIQSTGKTKTILHKGKTYIIPFMPDQTGKDLYPITDEGIMFYLSLNEPAYMQSFSQDIIKWIRYYAVTKKTWTEKTIKKYRIWEPRIKECFELFDIPPETAPLCILESGCNPNAVSSAGALGMWQIMPKTAREHRLEVNNVLDERRDPMKSMIAAAGILKSYHRQLKDWTLAVAAYNCGTGRIERSIKKANSRRWDDIKNILPGETQQYIPALIALNYILSNY